MWATPFPVLMAKSSIAYNPLIYIFFTARYREDFVALVHDWMHFQGKGNRSTGNTKCSFRVPNANNGNVAVNDSPGGSGTSSLQLTRQITSTTVTNITTNGIPKNGTIQINKLSKEENEDDFGCEHDVEEFELDDDNNVSARVVILQKDEESAQFFIRHSHANIPSQIIAMINGNGTSTLVATTTTTNAASKSLLSLRGGCSTVSVEEQV